MATSSVFSGSVTATTITATTSVVLPAVIDVSGQATNVAVADNTTNALTISQGAFPYIAVSTDNGAESINLGNAPSATAGAPNASVNFVTVGALTTNGMDFGSRCLLTEQFTKRPLLPADIATTPANPDFEAVGTNATSAQSTFQSTGGIRLTTGAIANDQQAAKPSTVALQTAWTGISWFPTGQPRLKINVQTGPSIATTRLAAGLKLSVNAGGGMLQDATDADQIFFGYSTDGQYTASSANWVAVIRINGVSSNVDTGIPVVVGTNYRFVIDVAGGALAPFARFYINGVLVATSGILTLTAALIPFVAAQTLAAVATRIVVQRMACSRAL